ncbi:MAG TPA: hypothetical protein VD971_13915 [Phycisphaerales bacterium]|nr:hypothetical protein [Phycisphaerales bacterium]
MNTLDTPRILLLMSERTDPDAVLECLRLRYDGKEISLREDFRRAVREGRWGDAFMLALVASGEDEAVLKLLSWAVEGSGPQAHEPRPAPHDPHDPREPREPHGQHATPIRDRPAWD